jgi:uncharacterized protein YndB with AHSA1/START domain
MPKVSRTRLIGAPRERVWDLIADPHNLPRWWPRTMRVEDVRGEGARSRWTAVLETERGSGVRADFRCSASTAGKRIAWEQEIEGTPFERVLRSSGLEIALDEQDSGTKVKLTSEETLRGLSRLGSGMVRTATRRRLEDALDGIELALVGETAT